VKEDPKKIRFSYTVKEISVLWELPHWEADDTATVPHVLYIEPGYPGEDLGPIEKYENRLVGQSLKNAR